MYGCRFEAGIAVLPAGVLLLMGLLLWTAAPARADLDAAEAELRSALLARQPELERQLERQVALNTGTWNLAGLETYARQLAPRFEALGFQVELRSGPVIDYPGGQTRATGPLLIARRSARAGSGVDPDTAPRWLLSGHMDTVFEPDSPFRELRRSEGGRVAVGPGAADMKGGIVVMLAALEALAASDELDRAHWVVLLDSDEEIGSLGSRPVIEAEARRATLGFVFESARELGGMVKSRRGLGQFALHVEGRAAHAGSAHDEGRSAVVELAHKILEVEGWTDYERGVTLNTGIVRGGTKRNIVPESAHAWIDLRYDDAAAGERIREQLEALAATSRVEGTRTALWGSLHRPPKPETAPTTRLLALHASIASEVGSASPDPIHAGGGTDGSLMAAVGLPTLDSLGVRGGRAHTDREFVVLDSLSERAAIAAILWRRLGRGAVSDVLSATDGP